MEKIFIVSVKVYCAPLSATFPHLLPATSLGPSIIFFRLVYIWKLSLIRFWSREYPRNGFDIKQTTDVGNEDMHD